MINHTVKLLSSELVNILFAEELRIKADNNVNGNLEVDRVLSSSLELVFDGYYVNRKRTFRLLGAYDIAQNKFTWE